MGHFLQLVFDADVFVEPGGAHGARGQAGTTDEFDNIFRLGIGQHLLERLRSIAFARNGKGRAHLHGRCSHVLQAHDVFAAADAACGHQWNIALVTRAFEKGAHLGDDVFKVKAGIVQILHFGRAQVSRSQTRVLDHHGIGQAPALFPLLDQQLNATRIRQNGDKRSLGVILGQIGQIQRQTRAHHQGIDFGFKRGLDVFGIRPQRLHDVDGNQATAFGDLARAVDFPAKRRHVGSVDDALGRWNVFRLFQWMGFFHQIRMQPPQIDGRDGAHGAHGRHGTGQPASRNPHAHATLHHRQQALAANLQQVQTGFFCQGAQTLCNRTLRIVCHLFCLPGLMTDAATAHLAQYSELTVRDSIRPFAHCPYFPQYGSRHERPAAREQTD